MSEIHGNFFCFRGKIIRFNYDGSALTKALAAIKSSELKIRAACCKYGVPRATVQDRLHGRVSDGPTKMGPPTVLNPREDFELVKLLNNVLQCGFARNAEALLDTVQQIIRKENRQTPFKNDRPGRSWYEGFMKRHKLSLRVPESISKARALVTEESIRNHIWIHKLLRKYFLTQKNV